MKAPLRTRAPGAVHPTPTRRLTSPAAAEPAAKRPHAAAETGPREAPARSSPPTSLGEPHGVERLERDHPDRPEHLDEDEGEQHREDPRRRTPLAMVRGVSFAELRARWKPVASTWVRGSPMNSAMAARCTKPRATAM